MDLTFCCITEINKVAAQFADSYQCQLLHTPQYKGQAIIMVCVDYLCMYKVIILEKKLITEC